MPVTQVNTPDGKIIDVDHPAGALERDILSYAAQQYSSDPSIAYEPTTALGALGEAGKRLVGGTITGTSRVFTGLGELIPGVDDEAAREVQRDVDEFVADKLAYDPAYDESYVPQLGEVVGEMVPTVLSFALPGGQATAPARIAQLATMIGPAVSEGGMDRAEYEERTGEALSTAERLTAKGADVGLGMLERLGLPTRILKGLPRGFFDRPEASPFLQRIESMVASGLQEGVQEVGQGIARDLTTLAIYDPDRKIADSVMEDFTLGGGAGAVLDLAVGLAQTPLKGRKGRAPKPIEEMTEEEIAREQERRDQFEADEQTRREGMDASLTALDEIGPQAPSDVREDPIDPTLVDSTLPVEDMTAQVVRRLGSRLPIGKTFSVGSLDNRFFAEVDGEQYGPAIDDPTVAQELSNRLTATSQQLAKGANIEYIVENSGIEYTEQQGQEVRQLGRFIPSPQDRIISAEDANLATGRDIASVINRQKADRGDAETEIFTLEEVRAANKGDLGNLGDVLAAKDADFLAFRDDPVTPQAPLSPTQPRQPALGRRQQALSAFSSSFDNLISSERAFTDLFASKRMDISVDSEPFRGLVKRIIGKTPAKQKPLDNLSANERRYLYHRIRKLPSFQEQVTPIPDFSTKTPDADLVRIARRQIEVDQPSRMAVEAAAFGQTGQIPAQAEVRRAEQEARRTARPLPRNKAKQVLDQYPEAAQLSLAELERYSPALPASPDMYIEESRDAGAVREGDYRADLGIPSEDAYFEVLDAKRQLEGVPAGQELVPYDINQSALGQQLRDAIKKFGIDDQYATRMVERVGTARRDSDGNIYVIPIKKRDDGGVIAGSAQAGAKVIQVGLDAVMADVKRGASYEDAVAKIMNHEILHALRAMDLFTASEYSLMERLSRKYKKPGEGKTYGQWAVDTYGDISAVKLQEEAIAEMISDALTTGVVMDGDVKKPTGKPRSIFNKIINFFKSLVGVAENNDVDSFRSLVDSIQSGEVGRRERGVVRTPFRADLARKEDPERGITVEDIDLETGRRRRSAIRQAKRTGTTGELGDAPEVDEAMFSRRRVGTTGQYVGAPKGIDTPSKLRTLIKTVRGLAEEGEYGRFWYERSGRQILDLVGGDKSEAEKIVQAIAITSAQTPVAGNFQYALQAYYQHKNGEPIRTGMFTTDMSKKLENMFNGVPWEGRKTNNFYINLMREIDPTLVQGVTNDLWMMRAFQFFGDAPTEAQYNFVEAETKKLANQLGWEPQQVQAAIWVALKSRMESKEVRKKTEATSEKAGYIRFDKDKSGKKVRVILDPEQHRKNWFRTAMRHSPTLEEREAAKFDYMDAAQASLAQSSWESMPSISSGHMSGILEAPMSQKLDYHKQISSAMLDNNGNDIIAMELGLASPGAFEAPGFFEGVTSPGSQTQVVLPKKFKATELNEAEASAVDLLEAYSATVGILLKQDGVGYHRPFYQKNLTETKANSLDVDFGRPLTTEEMVELGDLYIKETGDPYASPISTPQGVRFINFNVGDAEADLRRFRERVRGIRNPAEKRAMQEELRKRSAALGKTNKKFQQEIRRVLEQADLPDGVATLFVSYNGYLGNNWTEKKNGENYLQESRLAQRPDLQQRVRDLVSRLDPRIKAVETEFADKYGWSPREDLNTAYKARPASPEIKDIDTEVIEPRRTITPQQADQAVDKNIASIAEDVKGVPRFSVKASPEAQYVAQNPDSALKPDEPMFSVRGNIPAVDKLTKGPDREESNGRVFMRATGTGALGTFFTKLKQGALDRYAPLAKYYQNIPELRELEADSSAIAAALFSDRSKGILASAVKYGVPVYRDGLTRVEEFTHDGETYRGLIGVMSLIYNKDVGDLRKLAQAYAMVQRGDYLKGKNKLTPVDAKSRKEVLDAVDALTDADGYNPVETWHEVWSAYNNRTIDFLKATGILNDKTADVWKGSSYIPFYRTGASEDALPDVAKGVFGDLTRMSEFRAYQGSDKAVDVGLVESVVLNLSAAIEMGMKNVAQQRITRDMQKMGLARQRKAKGEVPKGVNAIDFKVNGNRVRFEIDDNLIYDSMDIVGTGYAEQAAIKYLGAPANVLRELVTRDPGFMIANMMRDTLSTAITSGASFVPGVDTVKGLFDGMERLEKLGVVGGYDFAIDKADIVKFYEAENKRRTESMTPLNMFSRLWNWSGRATTASDAATRNAVYNDVLARTGNEAEAAFQAMEIINFSRRGANPIVRVIAAAIPFLNARFQGLDVFMRAALGNYTTRREEPPAKGQLRLAYRGSLLAGLTALYYLLVSDEDWYKEQDEHTREMNWLVPTDSGVPFRLPIPFEVGLLFKTIPEAIMANYMGNQSDRELRQTLQRGVVSTLEVNPLAIQAVGPLLETYLNYDSFTGRPIVPFYVDKMTPGLAGGIYSTQLATDIGEALNINPLKIDHIMFGYTGTLGSYVISLADALYKEAFDRGADRPAKTIFEYPLVKRFFAQKEGGGLRADAYDLINDVKEVVTTINTLQKEGRREELEAYIAARSHIIALKDAAYTMEDTIGRVRREQRAIRSSDMDPEIKRQMIEDLDANLNEYLKVVPRLKQMADAPFIQGTY
tara:strand:- start:553 stop:8292 length:7740 start_codon:yes stop_codon:yes gene_type:complete